MLFLNDANSKYIGDIIGTGDVGDLKFGMWHGVAGDMCEFCFSVFYQLELISCHMLLTWSIIHP